MKCQFCNEKCRLLKQGEPDFNQSEMIWYCAKHTARVLHHVQLERYSLRRDRSITGVSRHWRMTSVQWVNSKGQLLMAQYLRYEKGPTDFVVYYIKKGREKWQDNYKEIFALDETPKDFTPENLPQKISTLTIFS